MKHSKFRALTTALLLAGATAGAIATGPAQAAGVRPAVGNALTAAEKDAAAGNASAANEEIRKAESVPNLTSNERQMIDAVKNYINAKTGPRARFANDYAAGRYSTVVGQDADDLRKSGELTGEDEQVIAQAYYLMHKYDECIRYIRGMGHVNQTVLELLNRCAYEIHDKDAQLSALEQLVVNYNQAKYWSDLLDNADNTSALSNSDTLDIYRLRLLTNTMKAASDYITAAEIALQLGIPAEGQAIAQKGIDLKLPDANHTFPRLVGMAKTNAAADEAGLAKAQAAANAAKTGDALVKLGEELWGMGRYQDALTAIKAGIDKGNLTNPDEAQIRLAMAYIGLRQRDAAVKALGEVSKSAPAHTQTVARLWSIYARTH